MPTSSNIPPEGSSFADLERKAVEFSRERSWIERVLRRAFPRRARYEQLLLAALSALGREAARDQKAIETMRRKAVHLELVTVGLRNALSACEATISEQDQASAKHDEDTLQRLRRADQLAEETRSDLAALGRVQAGLHDRLTGIEQHQAGIAESTNAEIAAIHAQLVQSEQEDQASAKRHDATLQRLRLIDQLAEETRSDLAALGRVQAGLQDRLTGIEQRQAGIAESVNAEIAAIHARLDQTEQKNETRLASTASALAELRAEAVRRQQTYEAELDSFRQQGAVLAAKVAEAGSALPSSEAASRLHLLDQRLESLEALAVAASPDSPGLGSFASRMLAVEAAVPALQQALAARTARLSPFQSDGDEATASAFERFYLAFEDRYRGTRQDIAVRQKVYLPYLEALGILSPGRQSGAPLADLGCGRGEWLQLLLESGATGVVGVDLGASMINLCREKGLPVEQSDALEFLRRQPDRSLAAITAMHLVEHLPFPVLLAILGEARRVLEPGGLLIMETPNCDNLLVAAQNFHLDPTHRSPIPPLLLSFSVEHLGFREIKTLLLHPYGSENRVADSSPLAVRFNDFFYGPQDYAVIATNA